MQTCSLDAQPLCSALLLSPVARPCCLAPVPGPVAQPCCSASACNFHAQAADLLTPRVCREGVERLERSKTSVGSKLAAAQEEAAQSKTQLADHSSQAAKLKAQLASINEAHSKVGFARHLPQYSRCSCCHMEVVSNAVVKTAVIWQCVQCSGYNCSGLNTILLYLSLPTLSCMMSDQSPRQLANNWLLNSL